ncbi:GNAT family N-acetyltransferase [uncultured Friedmanniella sp.]|uniref:GNAT family N-acetyltransferase n=1 Tax=uncultured Friedmanniella sp. TaxID=335381 RepID=UPI0035CA51C5
MTPRLVDLAEHPELVGAVAELRWRAWGDAVQDLSHWVAVTAREAGHDLPLTLAAVGPDGDVWGGAALDRTDDGLSDAERAGRTPWLLGLVVAPGHRRQEVGRLLVSAVHAEAARRAHLRLWVATGGPAVAFYRRCGFVDAETFVLRSTGEPTTVLGRLLDDSTLVWPEVAPTWGRVRLRAFVGTDVAMVRELASDPYLPLIGSLPADADEAGAEAWIGRQQGRLDEGVGFSFCVADRYDEPLGSAGLWTRGLVGGRATAGYAIRPSARGRGLAVDALRSLTDFGWTLPGLHRIELYVEPDNVASRRTAERAGYRWEGRLRRHQEIGGRRRDMDLYAALR